MKTTGEIWTEFKDQLLAFIIKRVNDKDLAEDLMQEVFIRIHNKVDTIEDKTKLTSWIYQITRNIIIDYYRKGTKEDLDEEVERGLPAEEEGSVTSEFFSCIQPFAEKLPAKYAEALQQTSFEGLSQREYAEKNDLSYTAAKTRVQRARKLLKAEFENCCNIESDTYGNIVDFERRRSCCGKKENGC